LQKQEFSLESKSQQELKEKIIGLENRNKQVIESEFQSDFKREEDLGHSISFNIDRQEQGI
jgi:hypothetical protein